VRRALESFIEGKAELAQAVLEMDNVVDRMKDEAFGVGRPGVDPCPEQSYLGRRQRFRFLWRHRGVVVEAGDRVDEDALRASAGHYVHSIFAALQKEIASVHAELSLLFLRPMALDAVLLEQRPDLLVEIERV